MSGQLQKLTMLINLDSVGVGEEIVAFDQADALAPFDAYPFARKGIHAIQVTSMGRQPFPYWHHPGDNLALIGDAGYALINNAAEIVERLIKPE